MPYGDTPSGAYKILNVANTGDGTPYDKDKFGPNGALRLDPVSGDAATAKANQRSGLMIHAGRPSANGGLRPTNGCIRMSNDDIQSLITAISLLSAGENPLEQCNVDQLDVVVVNTSLLAGPDDPTPYDEGDPPPGFDNPVA